MHGTASASSMASCPLPGPSQSCQLSAWPRAMRVYARPGKGWRSCWGVCSTAPHSAGWWGPLTCTLVDSSYKAPFRASPTPNQPQLPKRWTLLVGAWKTFCNRCTTLPTLRLCHPSLFPSLAGPRSPGRLRPLTEGLHVKTLSKPSS